MNSEPAALSCDPVVDDTQPSQGDQRRGRFEALGAARRLALEEAVAGLLGELGCPARLTVELGCGHGHFLSRFASDHPDEPCLGIDFSQDRIRRAIRKQQRAGLGNLRFVWGEIGDFLGVAPPAVSFSRVFILYPDPWPKRRHHKNRLMSGEFLDQLAERSSGDCQMFFRTDSDDYFEKTRQAVARNRKWKVDPDLPWAHDYPTVFQMRTCRIRSLISVRR